MMSRRPSRKHAATPRKFAHPMLKHLAAAGMLAAATGTRLLAQNTTADVVGTATDASGAVIPNAAVELTDVTTHERRTAQSGSNGE